MYNIGTGCDDFLMERVTFSTVTAQNGKIEILESR